MALTDAIPAKNIVYQRTKTKRYIALSLRSPLTPSHGGRRHHVCHAALVTPVDDETGNALQGGNVKCIETGDVFSGDCRGVLFYNLDGEEQSYDCDSQFWTDCVTSENVLYDAGDEVTGTDIIRLPLTKTPTVTIQVACKQGSDFIKDLVVTTSPQGDTFPTSCGLHNYVHYVGVTTTYQSARGVGTNCTDNIRQVYNASASTAEGSPTIIAVTKISGTVTITGDNVPFDLHPMMTGYSSSGMNVPQGYYASGTYHIEFDYSGSVGTDIVLSCTDVSSPVTGHINPGDSSLDLPVVVNDSGGFSDQTILGITTVHLSAGGVTDSVTLNVFNFTLTLA